MLHGECQCGAVAIEVAAIGPVGLNCYCSICRKVSGSAFTAVVLARVGALRVVRGAEALATYNATPEFDRMHCGRCHAPVYGVGPGRADLPAFVSAALFDPAALRGVRFDHIFVADVVPWHTITGAGQRFDGSPPGYDPSVLG